MPTNRTQRGQNFFFILRKIMMETTATPAQEESRIAVIVKTTLSAVQLGVSTVARGKISKRRIIAEGNIQRRVQSCTETEDEAY